MSVVPAGPTLCRWCRQGLEPTTTRREFCGRKCRQTAWRLRQRSVTTPPSLTAARFAYADPPYVGLSAKYYRRESTFAGEVDHGVLVSRLEERRKAGELLGWALSASARSLATLLPMCPPGVRVCAWVKPHGASPTTNGIHNVWEAVIVAGGRQRPPGVPDSLVALPARGGGTLPGRKPIAFCAWLFRLLGMTPGDELDDLFPGSGVVARAWWELGRSSTSDAASPTAGKAG